MSRPPSFLGLGAADCRDMTEEERDLFVKVCLAGMRDLAPLSADHAFFQGANALELAARQAIVLRLASAGVSVTAPAFLACVVFSEAVGDLVLWAHLVLEIARRDGKSLIDLDDLSRAISHGVPTKEARRRLWQAQKGFDGADDNWLDTAAAWTLEGDPE